MGQKVIAIDPGINGAFVVTDGTSFVESFEMPVIINGREKLIHFTGAFDLLEKIRERHGALHVFLERAVPMAMGSKGAFTYGRGFEALIIAIGNHRLPVTLVEPNKWTREMHEGISADLRPKARSLIAVNRLYPNLVGSLPKRPKGGLHDGPVDALLIAGYGLRKLGPGGSARGAQALGAAKGTPRLREPRISQPDAILTDEVKLPKLPVKAEKGASRKPKSRQKPDMTPDLLEVDSDVGDFF